ncbi:acyltransferase [Flavobacterium silvaticum]|uniref:Acyltransferase n=1 Tax=Flavobacterium silvaticum TaxID=1852020 RepID=A0A972FJ10_9FLAO|nr:acyltransferase [Flavobacterium silvaticum]NMH26658.1 acyltransferase [Flavobacterium silvaticum]
MASILTHIIIRLRNLKYKVLSDCKNVSGKTMQYQPTLLTGKGHIKFGENVQIGVISSPAYYSDYAYLEARNVDSRIEIGNNVSINNCFKCVSFSRITIADHVLIGYNCYIMDNDGHEADPAKRTEIPRSKQVCIGENVFIGDNVTILKGVEIGMNSIIGAGSVVTKSIPDNAVAAGNPAQIIRML